MNQPEPARANENQLVANFIRLFIFIMSLLGFTLHLQSSSQASQALSASKRSMEDDSSQDADPVKRACYHDSEESNDGSSSSSDTVRRSAADGLRLDISGIAPLESTELAPVGSDACSLDQAMEEFFESVALEQADSAASVYFDAESERIRTDTVLGDAIGENVYWSICHELRNGRRSVLYKCHICSAVLYTDKGLLEHFVLEHEMDLIVV